MEKLFSNRKIVVYHKFCSNHQLEAHLSILQKEDVLITVDDGDVSFYKYLFPLLHKYKIPTVLFIITELIDTNKPFWWDELVYLLGKEEGEKRVWEVKEWPNQERVAYINQLRVESDKPSLKQAQLTTEQLKEMERAGVIIANHSHTHPMFNQCSEVELRDEFRQSKHFFDKAGLKGFNLFAYPNGNVNQLAEKVAKEEGISHAFLFDHKLPAKKYDPYRISRLSITDQTRPSKLRFILSGWHSKILPLRRSIYKLING
ncbi:polysaccharide deacetylase family protein [Pontibacter anaerobius]|uniref:Polysaccharide deacetylase family protein n=1 Tax=Pontibacter anaerobius TaxID=2993940 RepID=A0ABT3RDN3_9BACT|nr:polysaccharide deacetylase family protein [Pontibacter anaerobius]MCX2739961.1 polysaccharide deacetylase family protein [Pontibacter anaerobius]